MLEVHSSESSPKSVNVIIWTKWNLRLKRHIGVENIRKFIDIPKGKIRNEIRQPWTTQ